MCFIVTNKNFKIAKEDIIVYKIAFLDSNDDIRSLARKFNYSKEEVKFIKLKIKHEEIAQGYHSYCHDAVINMIYDDSKFRILTIQNVNSSRVSINNVYSISIFNNHISILLKCIIPKGTKYLVNKENQIVSELIKIDSYTKINLKETIQKITFDKFYNLNKQYI